MRPELLAFLPFCAARAFLLRLAMCTLLLLEGSSSSSLQCALDHLPLLWLTLPKDAVRKSSYWRASSVSF